MKKHKKVSITQILRREYGTNIQNASYPVEIKKGGTINEVCKLSRSM